jgi:hypothetical protein
MEKTMNKISTRRRLRPAKQKGAALILTVVVVMVLTTLGLAMVGFTTTEERTATSYRDGLQARATAEAGVRLAQEVFRDPTNRSLVPLFSSTAANCVGSPSAADYCGTDATTTETSLHTKGIWRASRAPISPARYAGAANVFFQGPFNGDWGQTFGGTYSSTAANDKYDLKFNCTDPSNPATVVANCWLDTKFNALLQTDPDWSLTTGKITDISFYGPPSVNGKAYGICTVRVTAVKTDANGAVVAREVMEAVIGDAQPKPAVLGNGDIDFKTQAGHLCGDGCENIHANGNAAVGSMTTNGTYTGGQAPTVTATGTASGGSSARGGAGVIRAPEINPWDLAYKPTTTAELSKYYLAAARPLDTAWTDNDLTNNNAPRPCGINNLARCQDYNLEYDAAGSPKPARTATSNPVLYKWDSAKDGWSICSSGTTLTGGVACPGAPTFTVARADDATPTGSGADTSHIPFNVTRVPQTVFTIQSDQSGSTVLIDGQWYKNGNMDTIMTVIAVGSIVFHANSTWAPAMSNGVMWITGRDLYTHSNCCATSNTCLDNMLTPAYASIIAAHEQILTDSQNALLGVMIAENRVNIDTTVNSTLAIDSRQGDHGSLCDRPDWPWALPTIPTLLSLKSVPD